MKIPSSSLRPAWDSTPSGADGIHFPAESWKMVRTIASRQGAPSAQALITRVVSDLIQHNVRVPANGDTNIKLEWLTFGGSATESNEATLVFHGRTIASIAGLWGLTEAKTRDTLLSLIVRSFDAASGPNGPR
jgi:hypothetical protein